MIHRLALAALLALPVTLAACEPTGGRIVMPNATPSNVESPRPSTSSATPSSPPVPSAPPSSSPTGPPAAKCSATEPTHRPPAGGTTPAGTIKTTGDATVALTFDDGPDPVNTPKLLDLLRQCGIKATFCVNGVKAQQHPSVIRRIHAEGHTLCNHTWNHLTPLGRYGQPRIRQDLTDTNNVLRAIVPDAKVSYFRAPGGAWTPDYIAVCHELGMTPTHWDVDTRDWESSQFGHGTSMVNQIISAVQRDTRPGSIILMHDYQKPDTTTALRTLLPWLTARFTLAALPPNGLPAP